MSHSTIDVWFDDLPSTAVLRRPDAIPPFGDLHVGNRQTQESARYSGGRWYLGGCMRQERVAGCLGCDEWFLEGVLKTVSAMRESASRWLGQQQDRQREIITKAHKDADSIRACSETYIKARVTYFIEAVGLDRIKIGTSTVLGGRLRSLQCASPVELKLLATTTCEEAVLHKLFASDRLHGEWFNKSDAVMAMVRAIQNATDNSQENQVAEVA